MTEKQPNHLISESSPYLLQHAYNPVDWYPWGDEALRMAREQNKLLVISIGYAACHWCHVMEHESFEDSDVAGAMNRDFVSIKVDREERPDIDQVYMAAAYATTGRGGWPLNVIALPDQRPVFAGTYFPKKDWLHILEYFRNLYHSNPEELVQQAMDIGSGMKRQHILPVYPEHAPAEAALLHDIYATWEEDLDFENGGTHGGPKFPMPANLSFLLAYATQYKNTGALGQVMLTLDKMAMGGIYDQLGGGFSRYSVDAYWHVPHFEKMLYDNAQLISLYSQAYAVTKNPAYKKVVAETIEFIECELTSPRGLYYASLDADSEGSEGAFYGWTSDEIGKYLGDDPSMFLDYYSCEPHGNWEHGLNILRRSLTDADFAAEYGLPVDDLTACIEVYRTQLMTVRRNRVRPATDDKILTCWNALMISALVEASKAFSQPQWLERAIVAANFYRIRLDERHGKLWRSTRPDSLAIDGFLDDYCFLANAFLDVYQSTLDETWLAAADLLTREALQHFNAAGGIFFNLSSDEQPALITETLELSDNVIPASNSQMARNLFTLGHLLGNEAYLQRSEEMLKKMIPAIKRNPSFHANWARLLSDVVSGPVEVSIVGDENFRYLQEFARHYLPRVLFSGRMSTASPAYVDSRGHPGKTLIYVCHHKTCFAPVATVAEALALAETV